MPNFGKDFEYYDNDRTGWLNDDDSDAVPVDSGPQVTPEQAARLFEGLASIHQLELAARRHQMAQMLAAADGIEDAGVESMERQAEESMGIDPTIAQDLDDLLRRLK